MNHKGQNRFVVLRHVFPANRMTDNHWDLMLETGGELATWSLKEAPGLGKEIVGAELPRHRLHYLQYEGPISDDRGSVTRTLAGIYRGRLDRANATTGLDLELVFEHQGEGQKWQVRLTDLGDGRWTFRFE